MGRGGRGGGGGGSRSSGGGGGFRSSGGRSGGSSGRGGRSFSSSSRGPSHNYHSYGGYRRRSYSSGGIHIHSGLSTLITVIFLLIVFAVAAGGSGLFGIGGITSSTIEREPLPAGTVVETSYYTDNLGWISSGSKLEKGMKQFYKETGVQPHLYLTESVNGNTNPSFDELDMFANQLYDELFSDESHVLLIFQEYNSNGNYKTYWVAGNQAKIVCDSEAMDILLDYVDYYYYSDYDEDEMFSKVFEDTAERMMKVTTSPIVYIVIAFAVVAGLAITLKIIKVRAARKKEEAAETERILNSDLEKL